MYNEQTIKSLHKYRRLLIVHDRVTRAAALGYPVSGSVLTLCLPACEGTCGNESDQLAHMALGRGKVGCHFVLVLAFCFHCRYFPSIFTGSTLWEDKAGTVAHACKSTSGKLSQGIQSLRPAWALQQDPDSKTTLFLKCMRNTHFLPLSQLLIGLK